MALLKCKMCGGDVARVEGSANLFMVMNEPLEPNADYCGILTVVNLGEDPVEEIAIRLPKAWRSTSEAEILEQDGLWQRCEPIRREDSILVKRSLSFGEALILKI
jgi:hypothetical protein